MGQAALGGSRVLVLGMGTTADLDPERILSVETGFRRHIPQLRLDVNLTLYQLEVTDALIPFQVEDPASEEIYFRNAGQPRHPSEPW